MNELHLFAGAGGGILGSILLGHNIVGAVEIEEYPCRVLEARQRDGCLTPFPIFQMDIREFNRSFAHCYTGMVDIISAGFPCQGWSTAPRGRQDCNHDLWPETFATISIIWPRKVFLENVSRKAIQRARTYLEAAGYSCRSARVAASALGAPYRRPREWLFAYLDSDGELRSPVYDEVEIVQGVAPVDWWEDWTALLGVDDGVSRKMDRLRVLGNAQVPIVAATAWKILSGQ